MKILLLDNAIDSFEWALKHLRSFLELDNHFEKPYSSNFAYVPFGKKQIIEVLKQIINYMSTVEFKPFDN